MSTNPAAIDPKLLEILVCPVTKGPLEYDREKQELISRSAKLADPGRHPDHAARRSAQARLSGFPFVMPGLVPGMTEGIQSASPRISRGTSPVKPAASREKYRFNPGMRSTTPSPTSRTMRNAS